MTAQRTALIAVLLCAQAAASAETYYGRNPVNEGGLTLVGYVDGTTFEVRSLPGSALVSQGTLNKLSRVQVPLNATREFKLVTSKPVLALLSSDCCNYAGSYFYPTTDGKKFYGTTFLVTSLANGANQQWVYTRDASVVTVRDAFGTIIATSPALAASRSWQIPGLVPGQTYSIVSTGVIAVQANAGNGFTEVPPRPAAGGTQLEDCNNDEGRVFNLATYNWSKGVIAVFNRGAAAVTFSLTSLTDGSNVAGYQNLSVPAGGYFHSAALADLGTATYQLTATGDVTVWAGDQEGGTTVTDMGDDLTSELGWRGQKFVLETSNGGATLFAFEANTSVTRFDGVTTTTGALGADAFLSLTGAAELKKVFTVSASRPISAQVTGGNGLNDWAVQLRPAAHLDTDGNGLDDWSEGGSCDTVAPDTDGDGIPDYADPDDDNDCLPDSAELATRTNKILPHVNANQNCGGATPVCDTSVGVCRQCLATSDCGGNQVCDPTSFLCVTPPNTVITSGPANPTNQTTGTFVFFSPSNPGATFECSLDGAAYTSCASPLVTGVLAGGSHTFAVRAVVGVVKDPKGAARTWVIDTVAPAAPSISAPANGSRTSQSKPTIVGRAEPGATVRVYIDGALLPATVVANAAGDWTLPLSAALADGTHVVSALAIDAAGNQSPMSAFNLFTIDTTPPPAPVIIAPAQSGIVGSATPTITGTAEAGSTVTIYLDGLPVGTALADASGNFTFTPVTPLSAGPHTVSATATDAVGNTGPASPNTNFTVDLTVLDTTIVSSPKAISNSASASFVFTANKAGASFECDLDGGGFVACSSATTFTGLVDGAHLLRVRASFNGQTDATPATYAWTIDTSAPLTPVVLAPSGTIGTATPTLSGTATPGALVSVLVDGITLGQVTANALGQWTLAPPLSFSEGVHNTQAFATSAAGNSSPLSSALRFTVDTTAPLPPVVTAPTAGSTLSTKTPTYAGLAEPNSTVHLQVDGAVVGSFQADAAGTWSFLSPTPLAEGPHRVLATASDAVGNTSAPSVEVPFSIDTTAPGVPVISSPANGSFGNNNRPVVQGSADPGALITVRIDGLVLGTAVASASGAWSFTPGAPLADGLHQVTATAADAVGNVSSQSSSQGFTIDTIAPLAPVITEPTNGQTVGLTSPTIRGTAEAGSVVSVIIDSVLAGTVTADAGGNWTFTTAPLAQGQHSVSATAKDQAGNVSSPSAQVTFTIDTTVLDTSILTGPKTPSRSSSATFGFSSNKTPVTYECQLDSGPFAACSNPATFTGLLEGSHQLKARAVFNGVSDSTPATYTWTVDTVPPSAPVVTVPADGSRVSSGSQTVRGTAEAGSTVTVILDSGIAGTTTADAQGAWSLVLPVTLSDGQHTVSATATDTAGNTGPGSVVNTFSVDTVAPAAPVVLIPVANAQLKTATPPISGTAEAGSTVNVIIDGVIAGQTTASATGAWTFTPTTALAEGAHTISATARDVAGNVGPASTPVQVTIDTTPPAAPVVSQPGDGSSSPDKTPTFRGTAEAGSTVTVTLDGAVIGAAVADASGAWALTVTTALADGAHAVFATATDAAGNVSAASTPVNFSVDTAAPGAPVISAPQAQVCTMTPAVSGTAEAGSSVRVLVDGTLVSTVVADASGAWSTVLGSGNSLALGAHSVSADATDAAGNISASAKEAFSVSDCVDAGSDAGVEADAGVDAGVDAGIADAGADAGTIEDGGVDPLQPATSVQGGGCGCASSDGATGLFSFAAMGLLMLRRRRRA